MEVYKRTPITFKQYPRKTSIAHKVQVDGIKEAMEKIRAIKSKALQVMERANTPNYTKEWLNDELFKIYLEIK